MFPLLPLEAAAIRRCVAAGATFGYGNLIDRLHVAWALALYEQEKIPLAVAWRGALLPMTRFNGPWTDEQRLQWMREYICRPAAEAAKAEASKVGGAKKAARKKT